MVVELVGMIEGAWVPSRGMTTSRTLVSMKQPARTAVVRVSTFAVPRPVMKFDMPPPPMPSAPPSLFCIRMTPISATVTIR